MKKGADRMEQSGLNLEMGEVSDCERGFEPSAAG
jgi:hypothetical protein